MLRENAYYGEVGVLHPHDIRYDAGNRAFCSPLRDGGVRFRLWTEPAMRAAVLVYNDGEVRAAEMTRTASDRRFAYWEVVIHPTAGRFTYSFALRTKEGRPVYFTEHGIDHTAEVMDRWELNLDAAPPHEIPTWAQGAVIYQIFPERFRNGDGANDPPGVVPWGTAPRWRDFQGGDLAGIAEKADYLHDLGVDLVYLTPIFASPSTHKYDCMDFMHVDPHFGGDDALRKLVDALHSRGMRIMLDASFNHCSPRFFAFQDLLKNGPASRYRDWFTVREWPVHVKYRPHLAPDFSDDPTREAYTAWRLELPKRTGVPVVEVADSDGPFLDPTYLAWMGVLDMPKLNQHNPETRQYFLNVAQHWLREFHIDGWRMDVARHVTSDFWLDFRAACHAVRPDAYLVAEIWGDTSRWLQGDRFDATMNYFFRDLCLGWFARDDLDTAGFLDGVQQMLVMYSAEVTSVNHNLFSSHDVPRFRHEAGEDAARLRLATIFQLTLPGAAGLYYGDEIGMTGGDDPDCRRAFPWDAPETWDREMHRTVRALTRLRKAQAALKLGDWRAVWQEKDAFAFVRQRNGERVLVVINRGEAIDRLVLPVQAGNARVLFGQAGVMADANGVVVTGVPAMDGVVIRLS